MADRDHEKEHARLLAVWMRLSFAMMLGLSVIVNTVILLIYGYRPLTLAGLVLCGIGFPSTVLRVRRMWKSFDA